LVTDSYLYHLVKDDPVDSTNGNILKEALWH
jgi:hypothetical protein